MGEVQRHGLEFWCQKIVSDESLLAQDKAGKKLGEQGFDGKITKTFCNIALHRICRGMEYDTFEGMLADQIFDRCLAKWIVPPGTNQERLNAAVAAAELGDLAILAVRSDKLRGVLHGHCAIVYPDKNKGYSGKWGLYCPKVANVGKTNGILGANYAFEEVPFAFILGRTTC